MWTYRINHPLYKTEESGKLLKRGHKKTPAFQGHVAFFAHSPHLAVAPPELAPFLFRTSGLPGFIGPFPSTSLDESNLTDMFSCSGSSNL
jgi:hypothetical protein